MDDDCLHAGWEVFGIKYTVHEPLSTVLNQVAEGSYQAVASLLWKLKRAEHSLSAAWLALNGMQRSIGQVSAIAKQHNIFLPGEPVLRPRQQVARMPPHECSAGCRQYAWPGTCCIYCYVCRIPKFQQPAATLGVTFCMVGHGKTLLQGFEGFLCRGCIDGFCW